MKRTPPLLRIRRLRNARPTIQRRVAIRALALFAAFIAFGPTPAVAEGRVYSQPEDVEPLSPGNKIPTAVVQTVLGKPIDLAAAIGDSGALLVFYRGGWWPYCNTQLGELRKVEAELESLGFKVIALSPDTPEKLQESLKAKGLGYALYSDSSLDVARRFGIVFQLDDALVKEYEGYGVDLEAASGMAHHQLPVPSVFLVDSKGEILWVYSNSDYQVRPDNAQLLEAAKRFASRTAP